ncbi:MAG TPA: bifunctional diaminohydroxyphosphoribosylaminopyrimidine deaminase/5-amino-6-(5-phosphoribosylamino)uracil reductase RibD [Micropepsaceae bacterium]|nr:bifunctional diaminohydroxyphosphoribosylaminopyrimidine deaminase/5-amino-6-(5-phosphoribosylamino)uracil reductase RibD [Micropepsaceae bacterium]
MKSDDTRHMRHALRLAARGLGRVAPNPAVGCVIVSAEGEVAGRGWTAPGGRPHAETIALAQAGDAAKGGTAYVTLEPCAHMGVTPPCADALIAAGVARVVSATVDPDPRVNGQGLARLRAAGIAVTENISEADARELNEGFIRRIRDGRPLVALKIAQSADGYVTNPGGKNQWITSERARAHGHLLRAQHDAIMVGIGTVLADDPALTCRLPGMEQRSPIRVILDSQLRLPLNSQLARTARETPVIVFTTNTGGADLADVGVTVERVAEDAEHRPAIDAVLSALAKRGITRLLVEGGPSVHGSLVKRKLVDRVHIYTAPLLVEEGGKPGIAANLDLAPHLEIKERLNLGPDVLESYAFTV